MIKVDLLFPCQALYDTIPTQAVLLGRLGPGGAPDLASACVVRASEVAVGDHMLVKPGEQVRLDFILSAECSLQLCTLRPAPCSSALFAHIRLAFLQVPLGDMFSAHSSCFNYCTLWRFCLMLMTHDSCPAGPAGRHDQPASFRDL